MQTLGYGKSHAKNIIFACNFTGNSAAYYGGGVYMEPRLGSMGPPRIELINTIFKSNVALDGGAVYSQGYGSIVLIRNTVFERNVARRYGGAIYFHTTPDCEMVDNLDLQFNVTVFAESVKVHRNSAKFAGGGIFSCGQVDTLSMVDGLHRWEL